MSGHALHTDGQGAGTSKKRMLSELAAGKGIHENPRKTDEQGVDSESMHG